MSTAGLFVHYTALFGGRLATNSAVMTNDAPFSTIDDVKALQDSIQKLWGYESGSVRLTFWKRMEAPEKYIKERSIYGGELQKRLIKRESPQPDDCSDGFAVTYWPDDAPPNLQGKPQHKRNCSGDQYNPAGINDINCTCGLRERIALETERTMHKAWRKRAEEAEAALLKREPSIQDRTLALWRAYQDNPTTETQHQFLNAYHAYFESFNEQGKRG